MTELFNNLQFDITSEAGRKALAEQIQDDIDAYCCELYESDHRNHLGASEMGDQCLRKLWYKFRWAKRPNFDGRTRRLFNVGHSAEPRFIKYLKGAGFQVKEFEKDILHYHPESDSYFYNNEFKQGDGLVEDVSDYPHHVIRADGLGVKPKQWRIEGAKGHYGGSLDGMCKAPARYNLSTDLVMLNEFKTNNTGKGFNDVGESGVKKAKPMHYAQMCQYGYKKQLRYGLYLIENKNDSDMKIEIVELDWNYGAALEKKAEEIIFSQEAPPRIAENPSFFNCKYCDLSDICHNGTTPEKNCRSCRQATPTDNGTWTCTRFNSVIPEEWIKQGCSEWNAI